MEVPKVNLVCLVQETNAVRMCQDGFRQTCQRVEILVYSEYHTDEDFLHLCVFLFICLFVFFFLS